MARAPVPITVALGDGIGPEIMRATLFILKEAGAALDICEVEIGEKLYQRGEKAGIHSSTWKAIRNSKAFLKSPITTPQGGGFKSLNVTVRTSLGLYANVRPCIAYAPFIKTKHPGMDVVIIRENEEDLYMGIEYQHTSETFTALKVMTRPGCERIIRYAFEYAIAHQRKKVTCFTKDNILKMTDGLFHKVFEEIGMEYPTLEKEHWIVDIGAAKLADNPTDFDVIVLPNLYGDILSDVAAQIAGSVGLAGSANIGVSGAMFEAIHGSAPPLAGKNLANPSGLLFSAIQMLVHIHQFDVATSIHNGWLKTIEDGIHTYDIYKEGKSSQKVGTKEFAEAVVQRLGQSPTQLIPVQYVYSKETIPHEPKIVPKTQKKLIGVDIFVEWESTVEKLSGLLSSCENEYLKLTFITNRGVQVWPEKVEGTVYSDSWRCRFSAVDESHSLLYQKALNLLQNLTKKQLEIVQTHSLFTFS
jgi:isocitrate dehydrogenase